MKFTAVFAYLSAILLIVSCGVSRNAATAIDTSDTPHQQDSLPVSSDYMDLDGFKVWYGEYVINGVEAYEKMPEHLMESAKERLKNERMFKDGTRIVINKDGTYEIKEDGTTISRGTHNIGIYFAWTTEWSCWYYPGDKSFMGFFRLTDDNGQEISALMHVGADKEYGKERGVPWVYEGFRIFDDNRMGYDFGIRYGLTFCE